MPTPQTLLVYADHPEADAFISADPLALLIGMVLDQQQTIERAFTAPFDLVHRLGRPAIVGSLDAGELATMDPDALATLFAIVPALHRFPRSMAKRTQELCAHIADRYRGNAGEVWATAATGEELCDRMRVMPGFGEHKAKIFTALVAKRLGHELPGWVEASAPFGEEGALRSVADIDGPETKARIRALKAEAAAKPAAAKPAAANQAAAKPAAAKSSGAATSTATPAATDGSGRGRRPPRNTKR